MLFQLPIGSVQKISPIKELIEFFGFSFRFPFFVEIASRESLKRDPLPTDFFQFLLFLTIATIIFPLSEDLFKYNFLPEKC